MKNISIKDCPVCNNKRIIEECLFTIPANAINVTDRKAKGVIQQPCPLCTDNK
jgi:hypothetical protein